MLLMFLAVSAIVPSLLLIWYFHARDVHREPTKVIWATFGFGVLTIPAMCLTVFPLVSFMDIDQIPNAFLGGFLEAFLEAAIPEETFKFAVFYFYCMRHREFDEPMDGIVYGVTASLGFATLENVFYVFEGGIGVAVLRAFTAVPGHACFGAIMGYFAGQSVSRPLERRKLFSAALGFPILFHGFYDFPLMAVQRINQRRSPSSFEEMLVLPLLLLFLAVFTIMVVWTYRLTARLRRRQVQQAIRMGDASKSYQPAHSAVIDAKKPPARIGAWIRLLSGGVFAAFGGLITLGIAAGLAFGDNSDIEEINITVVGVLLGLLPLVLGITLFSRGIKHLGAAGQARLFTQP